MPVDSQFWLASGYFNLIDRYETAIVDGEVCVVVVRLIGCAC